MSKQIVVPEDDATRKAIPLFSGVLAYFPDALMEVAKVSQAGNDQHTPGQPLHWAKEKSRDEINSLTRHLLDAGTFDRKTGMRHSAHVAWRALALLQREIEMERGFHYDAALDAWTQGGLQGGILTPDPNARQARRETLVPAQIPPRIDVGAQLGPIKVGSRTKGCGCNATGPCLEHR